MACQAAVRAQIGELDRRPTQLEIEQLRRLCEVHGLPLLSLKELKAVAGHSPEVLGQGGYRLAALNSQMMLVTKIRKDDYISKFDF